MTKLILKCKKGLEIDWQELFASLKHVAIRAIFAYSDTHISFTTILTVRT